MSDIKKNSILVADDQNSNIAALTHILGPQYTIYAAKNGLSAIKTAKENLPDLILLDILMPEMDGYEVLSVLKSLEETKDIPIIFITGLSNIEDEKKGLSLGASDYITKPFSSAVVKLRVNNQIKIINQMRLITEKERAEKSSRTRIDFLARISHEMLTPMNAIMGLAQVLKIQLSKAYGIPDGVKKSVDEIEMASNYLLGLIHDLLDVSGRQKGTFTLRNTAFSLDNTFKNISERVAGDLTKKQQVLTLNIDPLIPSPLVGDEDRLAQVITNLIINAIKFSPECSTICSSAYLLDENEATVTLKIEVIDNGIGISKEQQNVIFNLFEQVDESMTKAHGGIGLGLPISKRIIEMMEGNIWVESEIGKGSKFTFTCKVQKKT